MIPFLKSPAEPKIEQSLKAPLPSAEEKKTEVKTKVKKEKKKTIIDGSGLIDEAVEKVLD